MENPAVTALAVGRRVARAFTWESRVASVQLFPRIGADLHRAARVSFTMSPRALDLPFASLAWRPLTAREFVEFATSEEDLLDRWTTDSPSEILRADIVLSESDQEGLRTYRTETVEEFNALDIDLKELFAVNVVIFIDYDAGAACLFRPADYDMASRLPSIPLLPTLYHGTTAEAAAALLREGWKPGAGAMGGNCGNSRYLYLTDDLENALWFASVKGANTVVVIRDVPVTSVMSDPEDRGGETIEAQLATRQKLGLPISVALTVPVPPTRFESVQIEAVSIG